MYLQTFFRMRSWLGKESNKLNWTRLASGYELDQKVDFERSCWDWGKSSSPCSFKYVIEDQLGQVGTVLDSYITNVSGFVSVTAPNFSWRLSRWAPFSLMVELDVGKGQLVKFSWTRIATESELIQQVNLFFVRSWREVFECCGCEAVSKQQLNLDQVSWLSWSLRWAAGPEVEVSHLAVQLWYGGAMSGGCCKTPLFPIVKIYFNCSNGSWLLFSLPLETTSWTWHGQDILPLLW